MGLDIIIDFLAEYWDRIKDGWPNVAIAIFISFLLIKPMFQISIFSGLLYVGTLIWLFVWKVEVFVEYPGYSVVIYGILAIRWAIGDVRNGGFDFLGGGELVSGIIYVIVWVMIYLKTKEIQRH